MESVREHLAKTGDNNFIEEIKTKRKYSSTLE